MVTLGELSDNWRSVQERVRRAAERVGRDPNQVQIMAVTKTQPLETVRMALQAGIRLLGENRIQEARSKFSRDSAEADLVTVNGEVVRLDSEGRFRKTVELHDEGWKDLVVQAEDPSGNSTERRQRVYVEVY